VFIFYIHVIVLCTLLIKENGVFLGLTYFYSYFFLLTCTERGNVLNTFCQHILHRQHL